MFFLRHHLPRPLLYLYFATLVIVLVAGAVLHLSGTALDIIRVARIVVILAIVGGVALVRRRQARAAEADPQPQSQSLRQPDRD